MSLDSEIQARIRAFVSELTALVKQAAIESVSAALGAPVRRGPGRPPGKRGPGRPPKSPSKTGKKRSAAVLAAIEARLFSEIRTKPGRRIEEIAESMGRKTKELALPARKLIGAKRVTTKGVKRATKYYSAFKVQAGNRS